MPGEQKSASLTADQFVGEAVADLLPIIWESEITASRLRQSD